MAVVLKATLDSVRMKGGEWKVTLNVPQSETELIGNMCNMYQEVLLAVTIDEVFSPVVGAGSAPVGE